MSEGSESPLAVAGEIRYSGVSPDPTKSFDEWREAAGDDEMLKQIQQRWKSLGALTTAECRVVTANLRLLATLTAGVNYPENEALVRQLFPVDLLLEALDQLSDLGLHFASRKGAKAEAKAEAKGTEAKGAAAHPKSYPEVQADVCGDEESLPLREAYAAMHSAFVDLLVQLYVNNSRLTNSTRGLKPSLVWGIGVDSDLPEDYEDVAASVSRSTVIFPARFSFRR